MNTQDTNNTPAITLLNQIMFFAAQMKQHLEKVKQLEEQITAIQNSNNQLAEIAFDENRFTDQLLSRVDDLARESARDSIDVDDIATEVVDRLDISENVHRCIDRMDLVGEDKVHDMVEEYINDNNLLNTDEVEEVVAAYVEQNEYITQPDMEDYVDAAIESTKKEIIDAVIKEITNKLTAKENDHAEDNRDNSIHISGTIEEGSARSYNATGA